MTTTPAFPCELTITSRHPLRLMQALQDALVFRRARSLALCAECHEAPGGRCDDHACDLGLIAGYEQDFLDIHALLPGDPPPSSNAAQT